MRKAPQLFVPCGACGASDTDGKRCNVCGARRCAKCQAWQAQDAYGGDRRRVDGLSIYCKACNRQNTARWKRDHPGETAAQRRWRLSNPERKAAKDRAYYERNKEAVRQREQERRRKHRDGER